METEDTIEIELTLNHTDNQTDMCAISYTEVSLLNLIKKESTLRMVLDPFRVYPEERMCDLLQILKQRRTIESSASHTDWLADDMGGGYDKEDPFIDDSEAPQEMLGLTTRFGGFYVSKGNVELVNDLTDKGDEEEYESPTLPDQVPPMLRAKIEQFVQLYMYLEDKEYVWNYEPALKLLKLIDDGSFNLSSTLRGRILAYLSYELKIKKGSLLKKLRKIRTNLRDNKSCLDNTLEKLRIYVKTEMNVQIKQWEEQLVLLSSTVDFTPQNYATQIKLKKRFKWTGEARKLFKDIVKLKIGQIPNEDKLIEILHSFLDNVIKPMWPKGWITCAGLMRECRCLLPDTIPLAKKRKLSPLINGDRTNADIIRNPGFKLNIPIPMPNYIIINDDQMPNMESNRDNITKHVSNSDSYNILDSSKKEKPNGHDIF